MTDEKVAVTLAEHEKEIGSLKHRMKDVEELAQAINELAISVRELAINVSNTSKRMERYENSLRSQGERIGELEKQPAQRWNTLMTVIITALASGIITYILSSVL